MRTSSRFFLTVGVVGVLALAGCSTNDDSSDSQSGAKAATEEVELGPLDQYMSALWDSEEWTQERYDELDRQREELIAECMAKEGFEYIPSTQTTTVYSSDESIGPEWGTREFAEQYGYGIISWPGDDQMAEDPGEGYVDPNQDYVNSLSPSEQEAFYETLHGPGLTEEEINAAEEEGGYEYDWTKSGCWGWAEHELNQDTSMAAWEDPEFADLFSAMETMWGEGQSSPETVALNQEWAACMAEAGYPGLTDRWAAQDALYEDQNALWETATEENDWEPDPTMKEELREREIAQATADWDCADQINYDDRSQEIDFAKQQEFLDQHRDELEALVAKHGQTKS